MKFKELPGRVFVLTIIIFLAIVFWFLNYQFTDLVLLNIELNPLIERGYQSMLALAIIYLVFKLIFEGAFQRGIKDYKARYSFKKVVSVLYYAGLLLALTTIWLENGQNLVVAYGLIGAGIAIGLQDVFKNFVGGVLILTSKMFNVGDRVEMGGVYGDIIDIGVFYTTLMEIRGWVSGDQASGRITTVPNSRVINEPVNNYTKDHKFIWDEITVPLTYDSNWRSAREEFLNIVVRETQHTIEEAEKGISNLRDKYYADQIRSLDPRVYVRLTDNWIEISIRYTANVYERRRLNDAIHNALIELVEKSPDIKIASATYEIVGFPELKMSQREARDG